MMNPLIAKLLLESVERNDEAAVKIGLESTFDRHGKSVELFCVKSIDRVSWLKVASNTKLGSCIGVYDWLQGVYLASKNRFYRILPMFFKIENFIRGVTVNGWTVLHLAMFQCEHRQGNKSDFELVEILLDSGRFEANALTDEQETVLHFACRCMVPGVEVAEIIRLLLSRKVNRNQVNLFGQTALMVACKHGNNAAVLALMKANVAYGDKLDVNVVDNNGDTASTLAKKSNNVEIVTMMTQALFLTAVENGDAEAVKVYLKTPNDCYLPPGGIRIKRGATESEVLYSRTETNDRFSSKLMTDEVVAYPDSEEVQLNKTEMVKASSSTSPITFPIWLVAVGIAHRISDDGMVNLLLNEDRFTRGINKDGQTVIHLAMATYLNRYDPIGLQRIKLLLGSGKCDVNAQNSQKETVLHLYSRANLQRDHSNKSEDKLLEILLEHGIDVNRRNVLGKTALMVACEQRRLDVVRWLVDLGKNTGIHLDIDATDDSGETALMIAERGDDAEAVALLQKATFLATVESGNTTSVKSVLSKAGRYEEMFLRSWNAVSYVKNMATKGSRLSRRPIDRSTWIEGVNLAIEKSSENILELLLDYDIIVQTQEGKTGDPVLNRLFYDTYLFDRRQLRLTEILLKSAKFNVNAVNFEAQTLLHSIFGGCRRFSTSLLCTGSHSDLIRSVVELFLDHCVSVNRKDREGKTPLLISSEIGCSLIMRTILNWAKETGTWVDLDAKDRNGRTALMKAAIWKRSEDAEMLLDAGASINLSDNRGFAALHHALHEVPSSEMWVNFGDFPNNYESLRTRKEMNVNLVENEKPHYRYNRNRSELNEDTLKLVELLLRTTDVDVNALDYEGYSPLDIAHAAIPEISPAIRDSLVKKGAILNIFRPENRLSSHTSGIPSHKSEVPQESPLHRLAIVTKFQTPIRESFKLTELAEFESVGKVSPLELDYLWHANGRMEVFDKIMSNVYPETQSQWISVKDQRNRSPLHYAVIYGKGFSVQRNAVVKMLIALGCSVNEADSHGRTPLHYAQEFTLRRLLKSHGADPTLTDEFGISAGERADRLVKGHFATHAKTIVDSAIRRIDKSEPQQFNDRTRRKQINSLHIDSRIRWCRHLNPTTIPERLWKVGAYAYRHPLFGQVTEFVKEFMENLAAEITKRDPRFEAEVVLVGSSYERSKLDSPDEFDFNLVLTRIGRLCEVVSSPELHAGFVRIGRKKGEDIGAEESVFNSFFDNSGILITEKINALFRRLMTSVLADTGFVKNQRCVDWDCDLNVNGIAPFDLEAKLVTTLKLNYMRLDPGTEEIVKEISIDVVPCIHIDGWWPDEATSNISEDIKEFGCCLVFDWPQRLYPWVPYSESCARISFAPAESEMIKRSSDAAKQAFMIGKQMIANTNTSTRRFNSSYVLKTCLLHCIGSFTRTSEETALNSDSLRDDQLDYRVWLDTIMKCHLDFVLQDFCPCYLMPSFCLPIGKYLKSFHMRCSIDDAYEFPEVYLDAYMLYHSASLRASDLCFRLPVLNPISERFDQKTILTDLYENASKMLQTIPDDCDYSGSQYCDDWCGSVVKLDSDP